jgi:hypothetical protein
MLLYSIVVTSLVQATLAILRLRSRNLWRGLTKILESERTDPTQDASSNAFKVISKSSSAVFKVIEDPNLFFKKVLAPDVTWLDSSQLLTALDRSKDEIGFTPEQIKNIVSKFGQTERASSKRFQFWTRMVTIVWAGIIAVYFQLSTPALLTMLSSDESTRQELIAFGNGIAKKDLSKEQQTEAKSMFYLEHGRFKNFLYYEEGTGNDSSVTIVWKDVAGVIITVLLLSLGAPFWFNMLKSVVNLRDTLSKDSAKESDKAPPTDADVDQQIAETTESIARSDDPLEKAALKSKLGDLRVLKARMLSI